MIGIFRCVVDNGQLVGHYPLLSYSVPQPAFSEAYIETITTTFKSVHNVGGIVINETGDWIHFVVKYRVSFHHIFKIVHLPQQKLPSGHRSQMSALGVGR